MRAEKPANSFFRVEERRQFLEVQVSGFVTVGDVEAGLAALRHKIARYRAAHGRVKVLVDMREALVQSLANVDRLRPELSALYVDGDCVAVVTASVLQKAQEQRIHGNAAAMFLSRDDALAHLCA